MPRKKKDAKNNGGGAQHQGWRSRIVGEGAEAPENLLAHPYNPKIHPGAQQRVIDGLLSEVGWVTKVIVNQRTGHLLDGHARVAIAMSKNEPSVPVTYVDLSEDEERLVLATLDASGDSAVIDAEVLSLLTADLPNMGGDAVSGLVASLADIAVSSRLVPASPRLPESGNETVTIRPILTVEDIEVFERAMIKTGEKNRAKALMVIIRSYLDEKR